MLSVFEGPVRHMAWSHDVHEELTGVSHGVLEGLATGGEFWRDRGELSARGGSWGGPAALRGLGRHAGQAVRRRQPRRPVRGGVAALAVAAGARAGLAEGGVAVGEGRVAAM